MTQRFEHPAFAAFLLAGSLLLPVTLTGSAGAVQTLENVDLNSLSGTYLAARTADSAKDIASAAALYRSALTNDPENLFLLERALVLTAAAGDVEQALGFAEEMLAKSPNNHIAKLVLAVENIRAKRFAPAAKSLQGTGVGVLADLVVALTGAWARFGLGEVDQAIAELRKLKGEDWYEPFKLVHIGYMAMASGRTDEALQALRKARELDTNAVRITEAYARTLALVGRKNEGMGALQEFLTRFPDNPLARVALEDIKAGRPGTDTVATPDKGAAEALAGIGAAIGQEGGVEVASLYLQLSLYLNRDTAGGLAALSLGNLLDASNQGVAAIEVFRAIPPEAPFRGLATLRAALALDRLDRTEEAEAAFKEALQRSPEDIQAVLSYGNMLRGRDRFAESAEIYSRAIQLIGTPTKSDWTVFYFRGIAYERTKVWDKAEADFRKALELSPDQPLVLNYLGYSLVDMGRNLDEALGLIRKAVELRPKDGYIVDSLGWAYYRLGRYEEAVTELERAVSLRPEDPVIHDHLGDAYWKTGRVLEAQFQWRHARDFGAEGKDLERILKKIAEGKLVEEQKDASLIPEAQPALATASSLAGQPPAAPKP